MHDLVFDRTAKNKGKFSIDFLNRMEEWTEYLSDKLRKSGYESGIVKRSDPWQMTDFPTQPEIDRIRNNVNKLQNCFFAIPTWREILFNNTMDFNQANALEWDLQQIYDWLNAVINAYEIRQANTIFMQAGGVINR